jgi:glycosyltransferase involved in cell wall biosynthesis
VRVVVDARSAVDPRRTGVGQYTRAVLRALPPADPGTRFVAWYLDVRGIGTRSRRFAGWAPNLSERATRLPTRFYAPLSSRTGLPRLEWLAGVSDVVLAPNFVAPPTSASCVVVVVHDLAINVMPETAPHHGARWRRGFERSLRRASAVIVPSEAARQDLERFYGIASERVRVIYHGTDAEAFAPAIPPEVEELRSRFAIEGPYIIFLGGLEPRKNLETLVRGFGMIEDRRCSLVLAGGTVRWAPDYSERIDRAIAELPMDVRARVVRTGYIPDADRRALLSGAEVLAYPSRYEGFGFPILEGFAANVPVLTSNRSSMPEIAGNAALLVDPDDPASIATGLDELLGDDDLRNVLRASGTARVASFTWERCARQTVDVIHRAAGGTLDDPDRP